MITATVKEMHKQGSDLKVVVAYSNGDSEDFAISYYGVTDPAQISQEITNRVQSKNALTTFLENYKETVYSPEKPIIIGNMSQRDVKIQAEVKYLEEKTAQYTGAATDMATYLESSRTADKMTTFVNIPAFVADILAV